MLDDLSIIIVNYKSEEDIKNLYSRISGVAEFVVVDNSSSSELRQWCSHDDIHYIDSGGNHGYSGGNNMGIRYSLDELNRESVLVLNPDLEINKEDIRELYTIHQSTNYSIISPRILNREGIPVNESPTPEGTLFRSIGLLPALPGKEHNLKPVDHAHGSCMMISESVFEQIGYLNESFFMYYEEIEFCYRARRENINIGQCQVVDAIHNQPVDQTRFESSYQVYLDFRNRFLASNSIFSKSIDRIQYTTLSILISGWMVVRMLFEKKIEYIAPAIFGALHGIQNRTGKPERM